MAMVVKNDLNAKKTLNTLNVNSTNLSKSLKKIASGVKINSAADDASGYAISEQMEVQIRALDQDNANTQNAKSLMNVAEGAITNSVNILRTLKERALNAANDTNTDADRAIIQKEFDQSIDQLNDNALVSFNGKEIFDGSADHVYSNDQRIVAALYSEWLENSLDLIKDSTGLDFENSNGIKEIEVILKDEGQNGTLAYVTSTSLGSTTTKLSLTVNTGYYGDMDKEDPNGMSSITTAYLDRTIAHEMTHAAMASNIKGFSGLYGCIKEGAAEVVHGIDDERGTRIKNLADGKQIAANLTTATAPAGNDTYAAGYVMFRYMAKMSGYSPTDSLSHFMSSLASGYGSMDTDRIDAAISAATKGKINSFTDLTARISADEAASADGTEFLKKYCDIDLTNNDTGAISGHDSGGSRADKTPESVVPEGGSTTAWTNPTEDTSNINGLWVTWPKGVILIKDGMRFQTGIESSQNLHIAFSRIDAKALGVQDKNNHNLQVTTQPLAERAISQIDRSLRKALNQQTAVGAVSSRLEYTSANIITASENTTSANSVIKDADMAKEMTEYTRNNVLLQSAQSMLSQANQNASSALSLLQ